MTATLAAQFPSNMHRRTFLVLRFCALLVACGSVVVRQNESRGASISTNCDQQRDSAECSMRIREIESEDGVSGNVEESSFDDEDGGTGERTFNGEDEGVGKVTSRRKKNKGYGQMLMYFLGASKLTMLYVLINTVAAIASKALIVGKVALAIATALALKKAFEHSEKVSYEIIKHPHHTYEQTHSSSIDYDHHGGYGENEFKYRKRRRIHR